ncbi:hypothetical protein Pcinc_038701 [Petrolisthes cinctipes]|uniref:T-complex protein 1 subunit theta n=1 Tax=Petrolisthes cinctipes TaxID=88211 RepID=A0AAE1EMR4_PETCI|nr:hypothetical protein Pcinc_038701 [Petrolisthes cinctipes]
MALHVPKAPGFASMLKDGARHYSGLEEAVFRNISACKEFAKTLKTAYGPQGRNKMVINHLEKLFVTNDAATIIKELEIEHPAAKLMVLASQMQEQEIGDGTNWVIMFAGALLEGAEDLIKMGLTPTDVADGYQMALTKALQVLPTLTCWEVTDPRNLEQVTKALRTSIMSKQYGNEDFLAQLVAKACISILPDNKNNKNNKNNTSFNVDNVRVCKILGSGIHRSEVVQGMVFRRTVEGSISTKDKAKVAVYSCPFDITTTETKGTVLIHTAKELATFSRGEENKMEADVKALKEVGVTVVVAGGKIGDLALHYLNKHDIMAVRVTSKWDLRRLCKVVGAVILPKLTRPDPEEIGLCDKVFMDEIGDVPITVFRQDGVESRISTIIIRGSTDNYMDDIERAVDDAVNTFKGVCRDGRCVGGAGSTERYYNDGRCVGGAGSTEIELSQSIEQFGVQCPGLEQYAIKKFAEALGVFPKVLADNCGIPGQEMLCNLLTAHTDGQTHAGFNCDSDRDPGNAMLVDTRANHIFDLFLTKFWALKYGSSAACQILRVDQIIMAKRAGGPKPRGMAVTLTCCDNHNKLVGNIGAKPIPWNIIPPHIKSDDLVDLEDDLVVDLDDDLLDLSVDLVDLCNDPIPPNDFIDLSDDQVDLVDLSDNPDSSDDLIPPNDPMDLSDNPDSSDDLVYLSDDPMDLSDDPDSPDDPTVDPMDPPVDPMATNTDPMTAKSTDATSNFPGRTRRQPEAPIQRNRTKHTKPQYNPSPSRPGPEPGPEFDPPGPEFDLPGPEP